MKKVIFLISILLLTINFFSCKEKTKEQSKLEYSKYISGFTQGMIKSTDPIYIRLEGKAMKTGDDVLVQPEKLMKISPKVEGSVTIRDGNTIEFTPTTPMKNGQTYEISLALDKICNVPSDLSTFRFNVKVLPLVYAFQEGSLSVDPKDNDKFSYRASVTNSDAVTPNEVEQLVKAKINRQTQTLEWEHTPYIHYFTIAGITRANDSQSLELSFDKKIKNGNDLIVEIPGNKVFSVLEVKASEENSRTIDITMSDNVDISQDFQGLITIDGVGTLNFNTRGNIIRVYSNERDKMQGVVQVNIFKGIKNTTGEKLQSDATFNVSFQSAKPAVTFIGEGTFTPAEGNVLIPFSAVALKAVQLRVIKVFNQNMNFYLQEGNYNYSSDYQLRRVGRIILDKKISLEKPGVPQDNNKWQDYTINLADHIQLEKGVIYRVQLRFQKSYTTLDCAKEAQDAISEENWDETSSEYDYYDDDDYYYSYPSDYSWEERDNPCSNSYYYVSDRFPKKNLIVTSLGVIAKAGSDGKYVVAVNDLLTAAPVENCRIFFYNFQNQKIDSTVTNSTGIATLRVPGKPFVIVATKGNDKTYLKVNDASSLSLSNFDVSGEVVQQGLKGFIYGERGVWRPGNDIHLSFILEDKENVIPVGHPIIAELYDPNGNVTQTRKAGRDEHGLYCFTFSTDEQAMTGYWQAVVRVGGVSFRKTVRIESIKPNRLNIIANLPGNVLGEGVTKNTIPVQTRWMHGAKTSNLKVITELRLSKGNTTFPGYNGYNFDDRSRYFNTTTETFFDGTTDSDGNFNLSANNITSENAPGMLNALLTTRVFEPGGDFSIVTSGFKYSPYKEYVGIKLPESDDNWYKAGKPMTISGAVLTPEGKPVNNRDIEVEVYTLEWRWWWDSENDYIGSYVNRSYRRPVFNKTVKSQNGKFNVDVTCDQWGRYYVIARDKESGHSTGSTLYISSWRNDMNIPGMATLLTLTSDKKSYRAGEKIKITFPSSAGSVALVSVENGKTVKDIFRVPTTDGTTSFEIPATSEMCPNIYVNVSLIQPHKNRDNDKPIRLYGILNIDIDDPELRLTPKIDMPEELRPSQNFTVTVSENNGKPMTYSIAIVDEGLLAITSFKTPNPFPAFYAREALGVKTWDFYDDVVGAFGGRLEKAFAVGGDEALDPEETRKSDRFTPVVIFKGPFTIKKGEKKTHSFNMPEYIGEVRTMVVAEDNGRYGSASRNTKVNKPLMLNVTMPRLFTPGDIIEIPVTVFAMKDNIKDVTVNLKTDDKIEVIAPASQEIKFSGTGEQIVFLKAKIKENTGKSTLTFTAQSGSEKAHFSCDVDIRIPNPRITRVDAREVASGESITFNNTMEGLEPTSFLEITSIPPLNLEERIQYLIRYPHGCGEQITSAVFPQLMLDRLMDLSEAQKVTVELHVKDVINRLRNYQLSNGGFSYWTNSNYVSDWVSTYITDFLTQAEKLGYRIPASMKASALDYLSKQANSWRRDDYYSELEQSYRLYVLALAGKPNMAAMNRMKEDNYNNPIARWQLAGAYALGKHDKIAQSLIANLPAEAKLYRQLGRCYGSDLRDNAIIMQSMVDMNMKDDAYKLLQKMARKFASNEWLSTQESAFGLCAIGNYAGRYFKDGNGIDVQIGKENFKTTKTVLQKELAVKDNRSEVTLKNNTSGTLHVRTINSSTPLGVITESEMSGLKMTVNYYHNGVLNNRTDYRQGEDIVAEITIQNTGNIGLYEELALTFMFPSGFEFLNERLTTNENPFKGADNADIRDDRVYLYFSLQQGDSKTFKLRFNAAYPGNYLLPAVTCAAMYDNSITATLPGNKITITRGE